MAEAMKPPAGAIDPRSALSKVSKAMRESQAAYDRLPDELKEVAKQQAEGSLVEDEYRPSAMSLKAFGEPGGMPAPEAKEQDPYQPKKDATAEDVGLAAAEVASFADPTPASDLVAAKMHWDMGDKESAGVAAVAAGIPFVPGPVLKGMKKAVGPAKNAAEQVAAEVSDIASAGIKAVEGAAEKAKQLTDAAREWAEKGTNSSFFKRWSEDLPVIDDPSERLRADPDTFLLPEWDTKDWSDKWDFARPEESVKNEMMKELDKIATSPAVYKLYHGTPSFKGDSVASNRTKDLGFHMGTEDAAHERLKESGAYAHAAMSDIDDPEAIPFFFKAKRLVPLSDHGVHWNGFEVLTEAQQHLRRIGDTKSAEYLEDAMLAPTISKLTPKKEREDVIQLLKNVGFDGAVYVNRIEDRGSLSFIAFPGTTNVKLADTSKDLGKVRGTFGVEDPRLAHGVGLPAVVGARELQKDEEK